MLDVGANVIDYPEKVMTLAPAASLFAFEPHPRTFQKYKSRGKRAVSDGSMHATIHRKVVETVHGGESVAHLVDVVQLEQFVERLNLKEVDLLKIDAEGTEMAAHRDRIE